VFVAGNLPRIRRTVNSEFVTLRQLTTAIDVLTDFSSAW
jgi:hypothetical protein